MDSLKLTADVCRICLEHRDKINWNNKVKGFCGISYKDCYYKYTGFVEPELDYFPTNLCHKCANELKNAHLLFEMALESLNVLQNIFKTEESEIETNNLRTNGPQKVVYESLDDNYFKNEKTHIEIDEIICYSPVYEDMADDPKTGVNNFVETGINQFVNKENFESFKTLLKQKSTDRFNIDRFKQLETSLELNLQLEIHGTRQLKLPAKKKSSEPSLYKSLHQTPMQQRRKHSGIPKSTSEQMIKGIAISNRNISTIKHSHNTKYLKSFATNKRRRAFENSTVKDNSIEENTSEQSVKSLLKELFGKDVDINALSGRKPQKPRQLMCQYCSVKVNGSHHLRAHEATHLENRERNIICPKCGIKLYTKESLNEHKKIHEESRKKRHKCEYCEKAFFHSGALNVHRRIHLGLMIKCKLCPKEFYRQIDLDRHLPSHSVTKLQNSDISVKKKKYKIQCQYCNKAILTTNWRAHKAAHLNQPQVKCKICEKNFFSRRSCSSHLRKTHRKERSEIEENIHYFVDCSRRMSHLMMKQQESLMTFVE